MTRETNSCSVCQSSPRTRSLIEALSQQLFAKSLILPEFPEAKHLRGLGLTDSEGYARTLAKKFSYENTYFHQAPMLDIAGTMPPELVGKQDFIISSEIFEHIVPPVARAFENVFQLLKPGGVFVLTTPFGTQEKTKEHFPDLYQFSVAQTSGEYVLTNLTRDGIVQKFDHLIFHGGPGTTLEMRVFSECDLLRYLSDTGFSEVEIHRNPTFKYGIWWPEPWSLPISARKPFTPD